MHFFKSLSILPVLAALSLAHSSDNQGLVPPKMTLIYNMSAKLGDGISMGPVPTGKDRQIIPILGGTFEGPRIKGTILNTGSDWLLVDSLGAVRPDARYNLLTDDGTYIYVQTQGYPYADGTLMLSGKFEAAINGSYAWLNDAVGVGVLTRQGPNAVGIVFWQATPGE